jgi:hypothetical protein
MKQKQWRMDHQRLILDTLKKYQDFPGIQADLKRMLRYAESQFRIFLTPIFKDEITGDDCETEAYPSSCALPLISSILAGYADLAVKAAVGEALISITEAVEVSTPKTVGELRDAVDNGISNADFIEMIIRDHAQPIIDKSSDTYVYQIVDDLRLYTAALLRDNGIQVRDAADRTLLKHAIKKAANA